MKAVRKEEVKLRGEGFAGSEREGIMDDVGGRARVTTDEESEYYEDVEQR